MERLQMMLALILAAGPAASADLWCMPDRICRGERCKTTLNEETSVRLHGVDSARPVLRSDGEDVAMRLVQDGAALEWQGRNGAGSSETLVWTRGDGAFVYRRQLDGAAYTASGHCEVQ